METTTPQTPQTHTDLRSPLRDTAMTTLRTTTLRPTIHLTAMVLPPRNPLPVMEMTLPTQTRTEAQRRPLPDMGIMMILIPQTPTAQKIPPRQATVTMTPQPMTPPTPTAHPTSRNPPPATEMIPPTPIHTEAQRRLLQVMEMTTIPTLPAPTAPRTPPQVIETTLPTLIPTAPRTKPLRDTATTTLLIAVTSAQQVMETRPLPATETTTPRAIPQWVN